MLAATPEGALMQRAATGLATVCAAAARPGRTDDASSLLVGTGNNGGDALFAGAAPGPPRRPGHRRPARPRPGARRRAGRAAPGRRAGAGRRTRRRRRRSAGPTWCSTGCSASAAAAGCAPTPPSSPAAADGRAALTVAVDVPSGIDADTGAVDGRRVPGRCTRSPSARSSPGWSWGRGAGYAGEVHLVDIGLDPHLPAATAFRLTDADVAARLAAPSAGDDKYSQGVVGVVAGSATYPGAGVLVHRRRAAHPARAWSATPAPPPTASGRPGRRRSSPTGGPGDAGRVQAWVVGPGMGTDDDARSVLAEVLGHRPAGGRRRRRAHHAGRASRTWSAAARAPTLLTPHDREFARFGAEVGRRPDRRRPPAGRRAAAAAVLLKGDATVVAGRRRAPPS